LPAQAAGDQPRRREVAVRGDGSDVHRRRLDRPRGDAVGRAGRVPASPRVHVRDRGGADHRGRRHGGDRGREAVRVRVPRLPDEAARRYRRADALLRGAAQKLVGPPVAPAVDVSARSRAEMRRADDEDLEAVGPGFVASPRTGRNPHGVPFLELDDLVVELHPAAPADDDVHLFLPDVRVAVREASVGRDALIAQRRLFELERLGCRAELQAWRAVEHGADVLQVPFDVLARERHGYSNMSSRSSADTTGYGTSTTSEIRRSTATLASA